MPTGRLIVAELLKVRKRWLPYVLFGLMIGVTALIIWIAGYVTWINDQDRGFDLDPVALRTFALPWSLPVLLETGQFWGSILIAILISSVVATEHTWGTVRQALVRGQTRNQYLTVKLTATGILAVIMLLAALGVGLIFSLIATIVADQPVTFDVPNGPSFADVVLMIVRTGYAMLPFILLAFCLAVVGRSTTVGIVGTILYMFAEILVLAILGQQGAVGENMRAFFMGHNASALLAANRIGTTDSFGFVPREPASLLDLPDPAIAALVLAVYCAAFLAIAYFVFSRRDLTADAGGS